MKRLLDVESDGFRTFKTWQHYGDDGRKKISVETTERVDQIFDQVKRLAEGQSHKSEMRLKACLPMTLLDDVSKTNAELWGISVKDAFSELMSCKTDRAKRVIKMLTEGSDYSKLQAKTYR